MQFTTEMFTSILLSAFLASLVTAIVTWANKEKENNLRYITEDRRRWREEIRAIVDELESIKISNKQKLLSKLKVRINPYGMIEDDVLKDSHIWNLICEMEKTSKYSELMKEKDELIFCLSLLLKYDWERAKREVSGDKNIFLLVITLLFGGTFFVCNHLFVCKQEFNDILIKVLFLFLFVPIAIGQGTVGTLWKEIWNKGKNKTCVFIIRAFLLLGLAWLGFEFFICLPIEICNAYNFSFSQIQSGNGLIGLSIATVIVVVLCIFSNNLSTRDIQRQYKQQVKKYIKRREETN